MTDRDLTLASATLSTVFETLPLKGDLSPITDAGVEAACIKACSMIAPAWPLDQAIAVNPHWSRIGMPLRRVAARMALLGGMRVFPPRSYFRQAWNEQRIRPDDLAHALARLAGPGDDALSPARCVEALGTDALPERLPLLIDLLDAAAGHPTRLPLRQAVTHQISQTCAAYFDHDQADWRPSTQPGLYAFWRDTLRHDHGIGLLMGMPDLVTRLERLPANPREAERWAMCRLGLPDDAMADYLEAVLLTVNGWASWCAWLSWQARLEGREDPHLRELLAIRLAWGVLLLDDEIAKPALRALQPGWRNFSAKLRAAEHDLLVDEVWQLALDVAYQRQLASRLAGRTIEPAVPPKVEVQAALCIDVRSERIRRALEAALPTVQTIGYAGFFGLPVAYMPLGTEARRPQLPGLLAPVIEVSDRILPAAEGDAPESLSGDAVRRRQGRLAAIEQWKRSARLPGAAFSFVESLGMGYLGLLWQWIRPGRGARRRDDLAGVSARYRSYCRPQLLGMTLDARVQLAGRVLQSMGIASRLAPLVLLVGHGSQSSNNAHAAALDCGACCGQTGEVNARSLAMLLNDPAVRTGLQANGIEIPGDTWFVAALHNTTTDEVEGFDLDLLPEDAAARWAQLQPALARAGDQVRRERAPLLGLQAPASPAALLDMLQARANDGAQTRPEGGLAGNAAFVIAPRSRTQGVALDGRVFLHDYNPVEDPDGQLLEQLLTAPMLVTHWINWQYHASQSDPEHFGSGNKVLHNVVGGRIGVFEGNGGDLRIGLARQSLHDGQRWMHEPVRLTVVVDASAAAIGRVLQKHRPVYDLVRHGWVHLWRFEGSMLQHYDP